MDHFKNICHRFHIMTRLSLHDRDGALIERNLPVCRMCSKLFSYTQSAHEASLDCRVAAFRPCGHVFHYSCIMERYQRMEDACTCVTCFVRIEELPTILFMEWSKSSRQLSQEVSDDIEIITAPDEESLGLRDEVDMLKHRLDSIKSQKGEIIRKLNIVNDSTAIAKAECEGLDEVCELMTDRLDSAFENYSKEARACNELTSRIKRDLNKAVIGELLTMIDAGASESTLTDLAYANLSKSADPDDLLANLSSLNETFHRRVKNESKVISQLRTTVHSVKKDADDAETRLISAERAKVVKLVVSKNAKPISSKKVPVIDRKVIPTRPAVNPIHIEVDDLGVSCKRKKNSEFSNLFS